MNFASVLKGRVAESILIALLERAGYRVTRLGVEVLFDEVKHLGFDEYQRLGLPPQLRSLPDLLVADGEVEHAYLVEVKLRRRFDSETARELFDTLRQQREYWPQAYAVIMIAEPVFPDGRFHQDYVRVVPLKAAEYLIDPRQDFIHGTDERVLEAQRVSAIWSNLRQLPDVFRYFHQGKGNEERGGQGQRNADFITSALRDLRNLG
jgi:hypothetical protein